MDVMMNGREDGEELEGIGVPAKEKWDMPVEGGLGLGALVAVGGP